MAEEPSIMGAVTRPMPVPSAWLSRLRSGA